MKAIPGSAVVTKKGVVISMYLEHGRSDPYLILSTDEEELLVIANTGKGVDLLDHLRDAVRVRGCVRSDEKGRKVIVVRDYEIIQRLG
ncbi:hypothetical protein ACFLU6_05050 [Acidobacteriota bacterium]